MNSIILTTLNARFSMLARAALLWPTWERCKHKPNWSSRHQLQPAEIVETLLDRQPRIIGLSVYIWNVEKPRGGGAAEQVAPEVTWC